MTNRRAGIVKWFSESKGYGFIVADDGSDVFVHFRSIVGGGSGSLKEGQRVMFTLMTDARTQRLHAEDVASAMPVYATANDAQANAATIAKRKLRQKD